MDDIFELPGDIALYDIRVRDRAYSGHVLEMIPSPVSQRCGCTSSMVEERVHGNVDDENQKRRMGSVLAQKSMSLSALGKYRPLCMRGIQRIY